MKTYLITTALITALIASSAQAAPAKTTTNTPTNTSNDYGFFFKPNLGADYQFTHLNYKTDPDISASYNKELGDSLHGANFHIGARVHKYLGFEAGYLWTDKATKNNVLGTGLNSKIDLSGYNFDALCYLPLDDKGKFELIGTAGVAHTKATVGGTYFVHSSSWETKGRIGAGAQYWMTDNVNVRGIVRYEDHSGFIKNAITTNLGLNYQF